MQERINLLFPLLAVCSFSVLGKATPKTMKGVSIRGRIGSIVIQQNGVHSLLNLREADGQSSTRGVLVGAKNGLVCFLAKPCGPVEVVLAGSWGADNGQS